MNEYIIKYKRTITLPEESSSMIKIIEKAEICKSDSAVEALDSILKKISEENLVEDFELVNIHKI